MSDKEWNGFVEHVQERREHEAKIVGVIRTVSEVGTGAIIVVMLCGFCWLM